MTAPALAVTQPDGSRKYTHPVTGETVPSVTTILKCISKPELDGWAARLTARYASEHWEDLDVLDPKVRLDILTSVHQKERQVKADKGTLVHEICDSWGKGTPARIDKSIDGYMTQFFGFLGDVNPRYVESECTLWNRQYGYAGTADIIAEIDGHITLVDIKTGRGLYPEHGLQVSALSHCEFLIADDGAESLPPEVTRHALLHLRPRSWKLVPVFEAEDCFTTFLAARKIWWWLHEIAPDVLGYPEVR